MKLRATLCVVCGIGWAWLANPGLVPPLSPQTAVAADVIPRHRAERVGLKVQWTSHVQVNPSLGEVAYLEQHINNQQTETVYELKFGTRVQRFAASHLDPFGEPYGPEGAKAAAESRAETLAARGIDATVEEVVLPEITLYALTDLSVLHAFDAETGKTRWVTSIGDKQHPAQPFAASDDTIASVNGSYLVVVNTSDGSIRFRRMLSHATGSGPAITSQYAFVPLLNGMVEVFDLYDAQAPPQSFLTAGHNSVQPTATESVVAWPNDRGHMNVAFSDRITNVAYRLRANRDFLAPAVQLGDDRLVAASADGFVHCVAKRSGSLLWECATGERIHRKPFITDETVYVISTINDLYRIPAEREIFDLIVPGIRQVLAASPTRIYCRGIANELVILDRSSGAILSRLPTRDLDLWFSNQQTDRIFAGTKAGTLQCLHEMGADHPLLNQAEEQPADATGNGAASDDDEEAASNPFRARGG